MKIHGVVIAGLCISGVLGGLWLGSQGGFKSGENSNSTPHIGNASNSTASRVVQNAEKALIKVPNVPPPPSHSLLPATATELAARYELTNDPEILKQLQLKFPDDELVVLLSSMTASTSDSPWLAKLEKVQPRNSVPNFIRASIHATQGDWVRFKKELDTALSKPDFSTKTRDRQSRLLDLILAGDGTLGVGAYPSRTDKRFLESMGKIAESLRSNRRLMGDDLAMGSYGIGLANKFRSFKEMSFSFAAEGNWIENELLKPLRADDLYGDSGLTVSLRRAELSKVITSDAAKVFRIQDAITAPNADPVLRMQYFVRMRADGELSAVNWLMKQPFHTAKAN